MNFDELCGSVKRIARRTAKKINETADLASLQIKLSAAEGKLEEAYTLLGRTSYLHFTGDGDLSSRVALAVENVDAAKRRVREIKEQIANAKAKAAEEKRAEEEIFSDTADADAEETPDGEGAEESGEE